MENRAEDVSTRKPVPLDAVKLFNDSDRSSLAGDEVLRRSWSWLAVVPADPSPSATSEAATSRGEKRVSVVLELVQTKVPAGVTQRRASRGSRTLLR